MQNLNVGLASAGGFKFKPWMVSGGISGDASVVPVGCSDLEKALGMYWETSSDQLLVKLEVSSKESLLMDSCKLDGKVFTKSQVPETDLPVSLRLKLTLRICLSLHSRVFDPLGLVLPTRIIGMLLFRDSVQILKKGLKGRIPWDEHLEGDLVQQWGEYFSFLVQLQHVKFPRSFKPENVNPLVKPELVTFSDGNPHAFGTVAYIVWTLNDGRKESRLVGSKAKLAQILKKSETVRNELNGATFSSRFRN